MLRKRWTLAAVLVILAAGITLIANPSQSPTPGSRALERGADPGRALAADAGTTVLTVDQSNSQALYRVQEQFVNVRVPSDAVGISQVVSGTVALDETGVVVQELSSISVNLDALQSDQSRRDMFIKSNTLETRRYPEARFVPTEVIGLPAPLPQEGQADITIKGLMTIRDVTREVEWQGTAHFTPEGMRVTAQTMITFDQFELSRPRVALVLSVSEEIRLETDILFVRES